MRTFSNNFRSSLNEIRELDAKVYSSTLEETIAKEKINSINPAFNIDLYKTICKSIEIDMNTEININDVLGVEIGVLVSGTYEYMDFGNYKVIEKPTYQADTKSYLVTAFDKMAESMVRFDDNPLAITYPTTHKDLVIAICDHFNWTYSLGEYTNYDKAISTDLYSFQNLTYRDVLDDLCQVTGTNFLFNLDDVFTTKDITETNTTIDDNYIKSINVNFGKKFGKLNALTVTSEETVVIDNRVDETSIELNGKTEFNINNNRLLLYYNDLYIDDLFAKIDGLEYYTFDIDTTGLLIYEPLDRFTISHNGVDYSCVMLNDEIKLTQGLTETIYSEEPEEVEKDYIANTINNQKLKNALISLNKTKAEIEVIVSSQEEQQAQITQITTDVNGIDLSISDINNSLSNQYQNILDLEASVDGIDLQISKTGGNNIFNNPVCYFFDGKQTADDWIGIAKAYTDTEIKNNTISGNCFLLQNSTIEQTIQVPNGTYTISFLYKKIITLSECSININGNIIELNEENWKTESLTFDVTANTIVVQIISNTNDSCYLSDLMGSLGTLVQVWSNNPNEAVNGGVKIGKGIEITSSTSNIKQKMDNDGNRIINTNTNEVVSEFTDKGLNTEEIIASKGQVSKILIIDMGNQTWFSRM